MAPIMSKKPATTAPLLQESSVEPIQPTSIIVIHPGSMYLRFGRASEAFPKVIPHVIARRNKLGPLPIHKDLALVPLINLTPELTVSEHNRTVKPQIVCAKSDISWTKPDENQEFVIGDDVLHLCSSENFNIHWPIRRGQLNLHPGVGGSLSSVLTDLESIWSTAFHKYLDVNPKDLKLYRAVLVIPDTYKREHVKELVNLLLNRLGFMSCFVHLESVCATFGAGVSFACVVDVGDQKTAVSCVEDGISHRKTRLNINYGGNDITRLFHWLQEKLSFPYPCSPELPLDALMLQELKEKFCHVNLDVCGIQDRSFLVKRPGQPVIRYVVKVGDECIITPLALFHPELLGITGPKKIRTQQRNEGMSDDPHDELYLIQTQRRGVKDVAEGPSEQSFTEDSHLNSSILDDDIDSTEPPPTISVKEAEQDLNCDQLLGIDQAIVQSIERCDCDEVKMKMYSCILVVGGGMMFNGIHTWLRNRLQVQIPIMFRNEQFEIITRPKDMDPRVTVWKGAALMSCLDTAQELWIKQKEWAKYSVKLKKNLMYDIMEGVFPLPPDTDLERERKARGKPEKKMEECLLRITEGYVRTTNYYIEEQKINEWSPRLPTLTSILLKVSRVRHSDLDSEKVWHV
ncbi:Actin-related protein 8 like protein [Argiope bruennichi]|uniref:Actin-related protein 8 n=1 Tax=Argiope bruennichi TaxID=94029 RepID=A0A8T0FYK8_ARGBR|nr:Actin-related protein 8 like protein [Argiope bruennichi]